MLYWLGDSGRKGLSRCSFFCIFSVLSWLWLVDCVWMKTEINTYLPTHSSHFHCRPGNRFASVSSGIHSTNPWRNSLNGLSPCVIDRGQGIGIYIWSTWREVGGVKGGHPALGLWVSLNITYFGDLSPKTDGVSSRTASLREGPLDSQLRHQAASSFPTNKVTCVVSHIETSELAEE